MALVPHEDADAIVVRDDVLNHLRPAVLEDHDAVALVLVDLVVLDDGYGRDADDAVVLETATRCANTPTLSPPRTFS